MQLILYIHIHIHMYMYICIYIYIYIYIYVCVCVSMRINVCGTHECLLRNNDADSFYFVDVYIIVSELIKFDVTFRR